MELQNKRIVIIGASSGMGLATASRFHQKGAHVVMVGRNENKLKKAAQAIAGGDARLTLAAADMTTAEGRHAIMQASETIDHLVVTAADLKYMLVKDFTVEAAEHVVQSKLLAPLFLVQA